MILLLSSLVVSIYSMAYAPVPSLPAAPSPYGTPLNGVAPSRYIEIPQYTPSPNSNSFPAASSPAFSNATASPPPPQPPQTFDEFSSNVGELDLNWNQLLDSETTTVSSSSTGTFVPSHSNIANVLTGGEGDSFVDTLPQWSENNTSPIVPEVATLSRNREADEEQ